MSEVAMAVRERKKRRGGDFRETWWPFGLLAVLVALALLVVLAFWHEDLRVEAAKTALQFLGVAVFGGLAALALNTYRQLRENELKRRSEQEENWRRELARLRHNREREDALLRSLLEEALHSYNRVKRARRLLKAHSRDGSGGSVNLEVYDRYLQELNDHQLAFEEFRRLTPIEWEQRSGLGGLKGNFRTIENYLRAIGKEYEANRHLLVSSGARMPLADLERLSGFFESHYSFERPGKHPQDIGFELNISEQIDAIIEQVQAALLTPVDLPSVGSTSTA